MKYEWKIEYCEDNGNFFNGKNYHECLIEFLNNPETYKDGWQVFAITEHVGFSFRIIMRKEK
jgi:hypothetical protein